MNQGPADLQSAALTTELCTHLHNFHAFFFFLRFARVFCPLEFGPRPQTARSAGVVKVTPVGFEPTQFALVELESTPLDHSGKVSLALNAMLLCSEESQKLGLVFQFSLQSVVHIV